MPVPPGRPLVFGHPPEVLAHWRQRVRQALVAGARTPFYLFSPAPVAAQLQRFDALNFGRPATHWYSTKTQPLPAQLRWWREQGRPAEVVSAAEWRLVRDCGFPVDQILVNGPAKHHWLAAVSEPGLRVNFDSLAELTALLPLARRDRWRTGLRLLTQAEWDPEHPQFPTQFGLTPEEAVVALRKLQRAGLNPEVLHFHLRTNLTDTAAQRQALTEVAEFCRKANWWPRCVDIGGGLPPPHTLGRGGQSLSAGHNPTTYEPLARMVRDAVRGFDGLEEIWLENGRALLAGSGLLAVRVLDVKERRGLRQLICDGGRTQHALLSVWEQHELLPLTQRRGATALTAIHGPTCMAFDQLARKPFPRSVRAGDVLLWFEAGAYHLPWETRFSHGWAEIWWESCPGEFRCERQDHSGLGVVR